MAEQKRISACVITRNEEDNIRRCLESLAWCDEIVVVDSYSDDRTVEICREYTDRVYQHEWMGYVGQRNLIHEMANYSWILFVDADEEVSKALQEEVVRELRETDGHAEGYQFPRKVYYLEKWIEHGEWYPDYKLRLFKKDKSRIAGQEPHDQVLVDGRVKKLKSPLFHYTYKDLWDHLETMNRFSGIAAEAKFKEGARFRWVDFMFRPSWRLFKALFIKLGILDGWRGFLIASISSFGVAMKYAKLWELENKQKSP
jgi:glycosyltransferase involved in cell wall biosynthesis